MMERSRLQDDLLLDFRAERDMINEQLELLDPLAVALRKPVAVRLLHKGMIIVMECLCWTAAAGAILFCVLLNRIYPFYLLARLRVNAADAGFSQADTTYLYQAVIALGIIIALLLLIIARNLSKLRRKNTIIQMAASRIKTVVGQQLSRKAMIDTIEQRHFGILTPVETGTGSTAGGQ